MTPLTLPGFSLFKPPKPAAAILPPPPPPLPTPEDPAVKARREKVRVSAQRRRGLGANILNRGGGLGVAEAATTSRKTLLGT